MTKKLKTAIFILASIFWAVSAWAFDEPDEFMGVKWGTSCEEAVSVMEKRLTERSQEVIGGSRLTILDPGVQKDQGIWTGIYGCRLTSIGFKFRDMIGNALIQAQLHFLDGRFESATLAFKTRDYDELSRAFTAKYGKPDSVNDSVVNNMMGATFVNQTMTWTGKQGRR